MWCSVNSLTLAVTDVVVAPIVHANIDLIINAQYCNWMDLSKFSCRFWADRTYCH
jgi:hypothetical protein